jgi:GNAT superfamily N-acetyltransferase
MKLRDLQSGDLGWIIGRNGEVYREEYGWNIEYEALVAEIVGVFVRSRKPREAAWVAEENGKRLGCVFVMEENQNVARLRVLLVDPKARGKGLGGLLVDQCLKFAKEQGYKKMVLWTNSVLISARKIYEAKGFSLVKEENKFMFGKNLVFQDWQKDL